MSDCEEGNKYSEGDIVLLMGDRGNFYNNIGMVRGYDSGPDACVEVVTLRDNFRISLKPSSLSEDKIARIIPPREFKRMISDRLSRRRAELGKLLEMKEAHGLDGREGIRERALKKDIERGDYYLGEAMRSVDKSS